MTSSSCDGSPGCLERGTPANKTMHLTGIPLRFNPAINWVLHSEVVLDDVDLEMRCVNGG